MTLLSCRNIMQNVIDGIDFVMHMLPNTDYPRNILVGSIHKPYAVWNRGDILTRYKAMLYEDCYINAYPNYYWMIEKGRLPPTFRPPPNHLIIDLDRASFADDEQQFQQAVNNTICNIKTSVTGITGQYPIVVDSGNGYHIHVPMPGLTTSFETIPEFEAFWQQDLDLDNKFLRFLERRLSNGKSDQCHNPSINSCMFRTIGTINTKARDIGKQEPYVKVIKGYEHIRKLIDERLGLPRSFRERNASRPTTKLLNDFYAYLIQERIDDIIEESDRRKRRMLQSLHRSPSNNNDNNTVISWVEKILQIGIVDQRKDIIFWVLAPYLITVRGLDYDQAYAILERWLDRCNDARRLQPSMSEFRRRVGYCLKYCIDALDSEKRRRRLPVKLQKFKEYYPDIYRQLFA